MAGGPDETRTSPFTGTPADEVPESPAHLFLVMTAHDPAAAPLRLGLDLLASLTIGRGPALAVTRPSATELDLRVDDSFMSKRHARITPAGGGWRFDDEGSKNGATVNGVPAAHAELADGDVVELGRTFFIFRQDAGGGREPAGPSRVAGLATMLADVGRDHDKLAALARSPVEIVLHGESGSGKEVLARAVHELSGRKGPFVAVNCGALPPSLVESELFGSKKGAFSGALADRPGLIRGADGGTLFLDEIGDLPLAAQAAFLRVLQEREVTPVGAARPVSVDLKLVAASHRDLRAMVAADQFRADLLARLSGFTMEVPPLRRRREDLGLIVAALLARLAPGRAVTMHPRVLAAFLAHDWPGNVRELEKCLATAVVLAAGGPIGLDHLPAEIAGALARRQGAAAAPESASADDDERLRGQLVELLRDHRGNVAAVARAMGKARMQVHRWMKRFGLSIDGYRQSR